MKTEYVSRLGIPNIQKRWSSDEASVSRSIYKGPINGPMVAKTNTRGNRGKRTRRRREGSARETARTKEKIKIRLCFPR